MPRSSWLLLLLAALVATGCDTKRRTALPSFDFSLLPGRILSDIGQAQLEIDPNARDPLTGLGACTDLITYCYDPANDSLDGCVYEVFTCSSSRPWEEEPCCPESCVRRYEEARRTLDEFAAFDRAFFQEGSCYPGVKELVP